MNINNFDTTLIKNNKFYNFLILGKEKTGKSEIIKHLLKFLNLDIYVKYTSTDTKKILYNTLHDILFDTSNTLITPTIILDNVIDSVHELSKNKKIYDSLFNNIHSTHSTHSTHNIDSTHSIDKVNHLIVSTTSMHYIRHMYRKMFDFIFIFGNSLRDENISIYNEYIYNSEIISTTFTSYTTLKKVTFDEYISLLESLPLYHSLAVDYSNKKVYIIDSKFSYTNPFLLFFKNIYNICLFKD
jgi:hypothetical protein